MGVKEYKGLIGYDIVVDHRYIWFHYPALYEAYDTYAKMKRYNQEWNGRERLK